MYRNGHVPIWSLPTWLIVTKLCHMFDHRWRPRFIKFSEKFGVPFPQNLAAQKHQNLGVISHNFSDLIANISRTQQDIINRKMALQTTDTHVQTDLIWCTLVQKQ